MKSHRRNFLKGLLAASTGLGLTNNSAAVQAADARASTRAEKTGSRKKVFAVPAFFADADDLPEDVFGDLCVMRKGPRSMTEGGSPTAIEPIMSVREWAVKAAALKDIWRMILGTPPLVDCPLEIRVEKETLRGDIVERRVTYLLNPGERTASLMLIPNGARRPAPALLTIHPTTAFGKEQTVGRGESADGKLTPTAARRAYGLELAQKGYITFSPDLLGAGERIYSGRRSFDNQPFIDAHPHWSGTGKDLHDLRRALDVMQSMSEIDATRIGSIGHSQGAGLTNYLTAVDGRVKVGVANCGVWPTRVHKGPFNIARTAWWTGQPAMRPFLHAGKPPPIDVHELLALAAPRPFLNISALNDCGFSVADEPLTRAVWENLAQNVRKIYALYGAEEKFQSVLHLDGHDFHDPMRVRAYAFLERYL
ncbi:MAG: acetylxylan esterase [Verrucomicrobia bacterium]|nr:acetylxylan esterase [Verrucomicrobiota bacterium]